MVNAASSTIIGSVTAEFWHGYQRMLTHILNDGECAHLRGFLTHLCADFAAEAAAFIWPDGSDHWQCALVVSDRDSGTKVITRWLNTKTAQQELIRLDMSPSRHATYGKRYSRGKAGAFAMSELILLKVPQLFEAFLGHRTSYVCLVSPGLLALPMLDHASHEFEAFHLSTLVDLWAWRVNHHRQALDKACLQLRINDIDEPARKRLITTVGLCIRCLGRMLNLRDVVNIGMSCDDHEYVRTAFEEELGQDLVHWHHCAPPCWPPCHEADATLCAELQETAHLMLYWCKWLNRDAGLQVFQAKQAKAEELDEKIKALRSLAGRALGRGLEEGFRTKTLLAFFLYNVIDETPFTAAHLMSAALADEERANLLSWIAQIAHYLFGEGVLDEATIRALTHIVSEYGHQVLGVPARMILEDNLLQLARGEPALHVLRHHYRDHFFHALEVCFLGHLLLSVQLADGKRLWELVAAKLNAGNDSKRVMRLWYLAALIHDIGYGVEMIGGICDLLKLFGNAPHLKNLREKIQDSIGALSQAVGDEHFVGYDVKDDPGQDHGVISALHLKGILESIAKDDVHVDVTEYMPAIKAAAMHNSRKHTISFDEEPLAFLLVLCDTVQEWNRPSIDYSVAPTQLLSWLQGGVQNGNGVNGSLDRVALNVVATDRGLELQLHEDGTQELLIRLKYNERINRNAGVFNLWVDSTCNFQRLKFGSLTLPITVEYATPLYVKPGSTDPERQIHRLKEARNNTKMAFLNEWFPGTDKHGLLTNKFLQNWVEVDTRSGRELEHLKLHLRDMPSRVITKDISEFRDRLCMWDRYHEDRDRAVEGILATPG